MLHSPVGNLETGIDDGNFGHLGSFLASDAHRRRASGAYGEDGDNAVETNYLQKKSVFHKWSWKGIPGNLCRTNIRQLFQGRLANKSARNLFCANKDGHAYR